MMTAAQAKEETMKIVAQAAAEFILNTADSAVSEATLEGRFHTKVPFDVTISPKQTGAEVVRLLEVQGYEAEHVYYDGPNGYVNCICIKWEDA